MNIITLNLSHKSPSLKEVYALWRSTKMALQKWISQTIACVFLIIGAFATLPYGYYIALRFLVCGICIHLMLMALESQSKGWTIVAVSIALIYNPIMMFHLGKSMWVGVNCVTVFLLITSIFQITNKNNNERK